MMSDAQFGPRDVRVRDVPIYMLAHYKGRSNKFLVSMLKYTSQIQ